MLKFFKEFSTIGFSNIISSGLGAIFWFYFATILSADEYGEISYFINISSFAFGFSLIAQSNTTIVYESKNIEIRKTLFTLSLILGVFSSIIFFVIFQRIDIGIITIGMILGELANGYFLGNEKFKKYAVFVITQKILMIILGVVFYNIFGIEGLLFGIGISYFVVIINVIRSLHKKQIQLKLLKKHIGFILNNYSMTGIGQLRTNIDKIMIMPIVGFETLGYYAIAFQVYHILMIFTNVAMKYSLPKNSRKKNIRQFNLFTVFIAILISIIGFLFSPMIISNYFPNFIDAIEVIPILSLAVIPNTVISIYSSKFLGQEKSKFLLIGNLISAVIYLIFVNWLVFFEPLLGIGISYIIGSIFNAIILLVVYKKQTNNF